MVGDFFLILQKSKYLFNLHQSCQNRFEIFIGKKIGFGYEFYDYNMYISITIFPERLDLIFPIGCLGQQIFNVI